MHNNILPTVVHQSTVVRYRRFEKPNFWETKYIKISCFIKCNKDNDFGGTNVRRKSSQIYSFKMYFSNLSHSMQRINPIMDDNCHYVKPSDNTKFCIYDKSNTAYSHPLTVEIQTLGTTSKFGNGLHIHFSHCPTILWYYLKDKMVFIDLFNCCIRLTQQCTLSIVLRSIL